MVDLPPKMQQPEKEVSLCLPLKPEDRPSNRTLLNTPGNVSIPAMEKTMTTVFLGSVQALIGMDRYMHQRISRVLLQLQKSMMFMPLREHNSLFWRQFKKD